ncbi:MAG: PQQ-dependent sugar dehydrogenase, partial [Pseudomonas sp.]|nr:PQQ-dependent sugar dehydrogenase [Pseudomonas sp.]
MFVRKTLLAALCATALLPLSAAYAVDSQQFPTEQGSITATPVAKGLDHPWALAFLPDQQGFLVTELPGHLRFVSPDGKLSAPLKGVPQVWAKGQGGLLDVVLSPDFKQDRLVYLSYAEGGGEGGKAGTAVGRGRLAADLSGLEDFKVILRQEPKLSTGNHFGSRLAFDRDGYLFVTL